ncbi:hypothetical protein ACFSTC_24965 [Nonomuraea ferruginea]
MEFIVHDTVSAMAATLREPLERRPDALREMLAPMREVIPMPGDIVDIHHQGGGFRVDGEDPPLPGGARPARRGGRAGPGGARAGARLRGAGAPEAGRDAAGDVRARQPGQRPSDGHRGRLLRHGRRPPAGSTCWPGRTSGSSGGSRTAPCTSSTTTCGTRTWSGTRRTSPSGST